MPKEIDGLTVWVTGKWTGDESWELAGVFATEGAAVEACVEECYFVGPVVVGERFPEQTVDWSGAYYPWQTIRKYMPGILAR